MRLSGSGMDHSGGRLPRQGGANHAVQICTLYVLGGIKTMSDLRETCPIKLIDLTKGNDNPQIMIPVRHEDEEYVLSILVIPKKDIEQMRTLREADGIEEDHH